MRQKKVLSAKSLLQNQTLSDLQTLWTAYPLKYFLVFTKMLKELLNSFISFFYQCMDSPENHSSFIFECSYNPLLVRVEGKRPEFIFSIWFRSSMETSKEIKRKMERTFLLGVAPSTLLKAVTLEKYLCTFTVYIQNFRIN